MLSIRKSIQRIRSLLRALKDARWKPTAQAKSGNSKKPRGVCETIVRSRMPTSSLRTSLATRMRHGNTTRRKLRNHASVSGRERRAATTASSSWLLESRLPDAGSFCCTPRRGQLRRHEACPASSSHPAQHGASLDHVLLLQPVNAQHQEEHPKDSQPAARAERRTVETNSASQKW